MAILVIIIHERNDQKQGMKGGRNFEEFPVPSVAGHVQIFSTSNFSESQDIGGPVDASISSP